MKLYTVNSLKNQDYEELSLVQGSVVMSKNIGRDLMASFKTIIGGELKGYTEMLNEARTTATNRLLDEAKNMDADAVIALRYQTSAIVQGASEILAYGTAIKFR